MGKKRIWEKGVTRRDFMKTVGVAGAATLGAGLLPSGVMAAKRDYILIGHPIAATGPLAAFGETTAWADKRVEDWINKEGGIFIKELGKKLPVKVKVIDDESNPTKAAETAAKLILRDKVDLMLAGHTPDSCNPISATCERYEVPCVASMAPIEPWLSGGPYKWCYHFFFSLPGVIAAHTGLWAPFKDKTNKVVGGVWPNDPDGTVWAVHFAKALKDMGYKVVDTGRFPYGMQNFSDFINTWKKEKVEILTGVVPPPDWAVIWRQCHQARFIPKLATIGKAVLFPAAVNALGGNLPMGLSSEIWWSPSHPTKSALTGMTSKALAEAWSKDTARQWTMPLGFDYAQMEVAVDALKRAGSLDKKKIRNALAKTDLETMVGKIKYDEKHVCELPLVSGNWVKGKQWPWDLAITFNKTAPWIPLTGKTVFPIPGS